LMWAILVFLGVVFIAAFFELMKKARHAREKLAERWQSAAEIAADKELSKEEWGAVKRVIQRHAPKEPLRAVTVRQVFDRVVEDEMTASRPEVYSEAFAELGLLLRDARQRLALDYIPLGQRIHSTRELYLNQVVWVAPKGERPPKWTPVTVVSVDEAFFYVTAREKDDGQLPAVRPGDGVRCRMWREEDARYVFTSTLAQETDARRTLSFHHAEALERLQSREYFRIRQDLSAEVTFLNAPAEGEDADLKDRAPIARVRGRIVNLSAGGFGVVVSQAVPKQVLLKVEAALPGAESLEVVARVVATHPISGGRTLVRGEYSGLDESTRELIARYVIQQQQVPPAGEGPERAG